MPSWTVAINFPNLLNLLFTDWQKIKKEMLPNKNKVQSIKGCINCAYVMPSDSASTNYRCGYAYFMQPAGTRKQERMDTYPEVLQDAICGHWTDHIQNILK